MIFLFRDFMSAKADGEEVERWTETVLAAVSSELRSSPRPARVVIPAPRRVFSSLFPTDEKSPDKRGFFQFSADELVNSIPRSTTAFIHLDQNGQGRQAVNFHARHNVREQKGGYDWRDGKAVPRPPFFVEELIIIFRKEYLSKRKCTTPP